MGKKNILRNLLISWPKGTLAMQRHLEQKGVSSQHVQQYLKSGWLKRFARGVYQQATDSISWQGALYALQEYFGSTAVYLGGLTALEEQGKAHFIALGSHRTIQIYHTFNNTRAIPRWFQEVDEWRVKWRFVKSRCFPEESEIGFCKQNYQTFDLTLSSPERAMFELLYDAVTEEALKSAFAIIEHLHTLRSSLINQLMQECQSYKTKRLVVLFAQKANLPWLEKLEFDKFELGDNKYQLGVGGYYYPEVKLSMPLHLSDEEEEGDEL